MEEEKEEFPRPGTYRTVACGGLGFQNWKTYCCRVKDRWRNCPDAGSCKPSATIKGCDDD